MVSAGDGEKSNCTKQTIKQLKQRSTQIDTQEVSCKEPLSPPLRGQSSQAVQSGNAGIMILW